MKKLILFFTAALFLISCSDETELDVVYPRSYFPAFPGSWWTYTNGERSLVDPSYQPNSYQPDINSSAWTDEKLVPYIDGAYLYEYSITQMSTEFPIKKLLAESVTTEWVVNHVNGEDILRKSIAKLDTFYLAHDSSLYKKVVVVVEYQETLGINKWNTKEYYADSVGLIRQEINNPYDTLSAIIRKELITYQINW